ncbi:PAS domain S-box protein [Noviherbaspirillum sp. Root189]|uniref:PAS domain S-box protein n=1 Tax=Noviherbaspirillum sp. Root189 TaxID=1736487 RepID=UPI00070E8716|nr:PAS domain S-box protein [Noviherbaspirillum sp. Root189]KRB79069.1 hypothetical protein ASE07_05110 [Noviherbaspirillum sp. Root189]
MPFLDQLPFDQRIRLVFDHLQTQALITLNIDGTIVDWSFGAQSLFGWVPSEVIGKQVSVLFTAEDVAVAVPQNEMQLALKNGSAPGVRWHIRKDGSRFFADGVLTALKLEDGSIVGFVKNLREATGALQLQESEAKFKAMVNATPHMVWSALADGRGDYCNERMTDFTGASVSELQGHGWATFVYPEDRTTAGHTWMHAIRTGTPLSIQFRLRSGSGEYRWVLCRGEPVRDNSGRVVRWIGTYTDIHEQKMAQVTLAESEELFRSLVNATSQILWRCEANGESMKDSPSWRAFTGQSVEEMRGSGWQDSIHPEDRELAAAAWSKAILERSTYEIEYRLKHVSGQYRWTRARSVPLLNSNGSVREWIGTNTDITGKKQTELALKEAHFRLEAILSAGDIGTWTFDLVANRMYGDANLARLFDVKLSSDEGLPPEVYFTKLHPDDVEFERQRREHAINHRQPYHEIYRVRNSESGWRFLHIRGNVEYAKDGTPLWIAGVALDVTALKAAEEKLRRREERYGALFNAIDEGFYIIELIHDESGCAVDYRFLEANPAAEKLSGLRNVVGKTLSEVVSSPTLTWLDNYDQVAKTGQSMRFIDYSKVLSRWFDISVTRLGNEPGRQVALLFNDITEQKRNEEELQRLAADLSQINRRQREFLATLAHELRNPLAPIRTGLDLLNVAMDVPEPIAKVHEMMNRQVDHLVHLVNDLLDLARINSGKIELKRDRHLLNEIMQNAVEVSLPLIKERRHELVIDLAEEPIWLDADKNRLGQVISNLLTNAAKYTPEGGRIILSLQREDDAAAIRVTDNGIGIAAEEQSHLFQMFSQVGRGLGQSQGGLGIGLNLVKRLTEKHGGSILVSSPGVGLGSTFTIRLPVEQRDTDVVHAYRLERSQEPTTAVPLNIVIADDNRDAVELLKELLVLKGHTVTATYDGKSALMMLKEMHPDLALLDIGMPGMDGYEVARAIRSETQLQDIVLAAVTGWGNMEDRSKSREAGFDYHLTKPVSYGAILEVLTKVQNRK